MTDAPNFIGDLYVHWYSSGSHTASHLYLRDPLRPKPWSSVGLQLQFSPVLKKEKNNQRVFGNACEEEKDQATPLCVILYLVPSGLLKLMC